MKRRILRIALATAILACLGAQAQPPPAESQPSPVAHLGAIRSQHPLQPGEASSALEILRGAGVSTHLVQVRTRIRPHFHRDHEETAYLLEGSGVFVLGERAYPVKAGSLMLIPKGAVHSFEAREPTVVLCVYDPPFDPADRNFVDGSTPSP